MYNTHTRLDREFMRRMIRAYEQDLLMLVDDEDPHPDDDRIRAHLQLLEELRAHTFSPFEHTVVF